MLGAFSWLNCIQFHEFLRDLSPGAQATTLTR
jgi:hypothetical protein